MVVPPKWSKMDGLHGKIQKSHENGWFGGYFPFQENFHMISLHFSLLQTSLHTTQRPLDVEMSLEALLATAIASSAETLLACAQWPCHGWAAAIQWLHESLLMDR